MRNVAGLRLHSLGPLITILGRPCLRAFREPAQTSGVGFRPHASVRFKPLESIISREEAVDTEPSDIGVPIFRHLIPYHRIEQSEFVLKSCRAFRQGFGQILDERFLRVPSRGLVAWPLRSG